MATRTYARNGLAFSEPQLNGLLDAALGLVGCITKATETTIEVTHASLTPAHDAGVNTVLAAYVLNPDFGIAPERIALRNVVPTLRQWSTDADTSAAALGTAVTNWVASGAYTAAKDTVLRQTLGGLQTLTTRLGRLCDRLADVLSVQGLNNGG
jgi:hypothetical protein